MSASSHNQQLTIAQPTVTLNIVDLMEVDEDDDEQSISDVEIKSMLTDLNNSSQDFQVFRKISELNNILGKQKSNELIEKFIKEGLVTIWVNLASEFKRYVFFKQAHTHFIVGVHFVCFFLQA